jgi:hypothetical protein
MRGDPNEGQASYSDDALRIGGQSGTRLAGAGSGDPADARTAGGRRASAGHRDSMSAAMAEVFCRRGFSPDALRSAVLDLSTLKEKRRG